MLVNVHADSLGCVTVPGVAGDYSFRTASYVRHSGGSSFFHVSRTTAHDVTWYFTSWFGLPEVPDGEEWTNEHEPAPGDSVSAVAAIVTRLAQMPDSGVSQPLYRIAAEQDCPGKTNVSCSDAANNWTYIGFRSGQPAAGIKYLVGHELGHHVQYNLFGFTHTDYVTDTPIEACDCSRVTSNKEHCLQSREPFGSALGEGVGTLLRNADI